MQEMIIDYLLMALVVVFLGVCILWNVKVDDSEERFFDLQNSKAMRGFWCLVVVLVHVPQAYQNPIQDLIGSFAYIGVTFFFMTSAYGLSLSVEKSRGSVKGFWKRRLPKLLVPYWTANIISATLGYVLSGSKARIFNIFAIAGWVLWLLACYFIFWISIVFFKRDLGKLVCCVVIAVISLIIQYYIQIGSIQSTTWTTECYGFIWGIVLAKYKTRFISAFRKKWTRVVCISFIASILLGIGYLTLKKVPFCGSYLLKIVLGFSILLFILILNVRVKIGNVLSLFLGKISYEIFLLHGIAFSIVSRLRCDYSSAKFIICSLIVTVVVALIVHNVILMLLKRRV